MDRTVLIEQLFDSSQTMQRIWKTQLYKGLGDEKISPAQIGLLFIIKNHQPISGAALADKMRISRSAVTQLVDGLDQHGYVLREADPSDRRITYIHLSVAGTRKLAHLETKRKDFFVAMVTSLEDDELSTMLAIQSKMLAHISNGETGDTLA